MSGAGAMPSGRGRLARQFATFAGVGAIGTAAHYLTLVALVEGALVGAVAGSACGFAVGALVNYVLNYRVTFRSTAPHRLALPRFVTVAIVGFGLNGLLMAGGMRWTPLHYLAVQVMATGAVLFWGFAANAMWTFKNKEPGHE